MATLDEGSIGNVERLSSFHLVLFSFPSHLLIHTHTHIRTLFLSRHLFSYFATEVETSVLPSGRFHLIREECTRFAEKGNRIKNEGNGMQKGNNGGLYSLPPRDRSASGKIITLLIARMDSFSCPGFRANFV